MQTFQVYATWTMTETFTVQAETLDEAIQIAEDHGLTSGEYLEGSFKVDREFSEELSEMAATV